MPLVRETDEAVQPSTYEMHESRARLDTKWQMSFAVTPSGDGQSLTRCILVIAVSCATRKPRLYKLKIKGGDAPRPPPPPPKIKGKEEGGKEGKKEGRKEGKRKGWQSVRRLFEKSGTCVCGGRGGRGGETRVRRRRKKRTRLP